MIDSKSANKNFNTIYISQRLDQTLGNLFHPKNSQLQQQSHKVPSQIRYFISVLTLFKQFNLPVLQIQVLILVGFIILMRNRYQTANSTYLVFKSLVETHKISTFMTNFMCQMVNTLYKFLVLNQTHKLLDLSN
jgi:hypothetical protein